jgi:hypothetical protein
MIAVGRRKHPMRGNQSEGAETHVGQSQVGFGTTQILRAESSELSNGPRLVWLPVRFQQRFD